MKNFPALLKNLVAGSLVFKAPKQKLRWIIIFSGGSMLKMPTGNTPWAPAAI